MKPLPASTDAPGPVGDATDEEDIDPEEEDDERQIGHAEPGERMGAFTTPEEKSPTSGAHAPPQALLPFPLFPPLPPFLPLPRLLPPDRGNALFLGQSACKWSVLPQMKQALRESFFGFLFAALFVQGLGLLRGFLGFQAVGASEATLGLVLAATSGRTLWEK